MEVGTNIINYIATDPDGDDLTFSFIDSDGAELTNLPFSIEYDGVNASLVLSSKLEYEEVPNYSFSVVVTDPGGKFASDEVTINVNNVNHAPFFFITHSKYEYPEGYVPPNPYFQVDSNGYSFIESQIRVFDIDGDFLTYHITSGNEDNAFFVESGNSSRYNQFNLKANWVLLNLSASNPSRTITIEASDGELTAEKTVEISIIPTYSHTPPVFSQEKYQVIRAVDNITLGMVIATVSATQEQGDRIEYSLDANAGLAIDSTTGVITVTNVNAVKNVLSTASIISLTVTANGYDDSRPNASAGDLPPTSMASVTVNLIDDYNVYLEQAESAITAWRAWANAQAIVYYQNADRALAKFSSWKFGLRLED